MSTPARGARRPKASPARTSTIACTVSVSTSRSTRPASNAIRLTGVTLNRSITPARQSAMMVNPTKAAPNRPSWIRSPGTKKLYGLLAETPITPPVAILASSGPKNARYRIGWIRPMMTQAGLRRDSFSWRLNISKVSPRKVNAAERYRSSTMSAVGVTGTAMAVGPEGLLVLMVTCSSLPLGARDRAVDIGIGIRPASQSRGGHANRGSFGIRRGSGPRGGSRGVVAQGSAGQGEEHVIQRRPRELDRLHREALRVERAQHAGQRFLAVFNRHPDRLAVGCDLAHTRVIAENGLCPRRLGAYAERDYVSCDPALQLVGHSFRDDLAVVDHE